MIRARVEHVFRGSSGSLDSSKGPRNRELMKNVVHLNVLIGVTPVPAAQAATDCLKGKVRAQYAPTASDKAETGENWRHKILPKNELRESMLKKWQHYRKNLKAANCSVLP